MLGMGILIFSSMIALSQLFVTIGGPMVPDLLADMPTIFDYTEDGKRIPDSIVPIFTMIGGAENTNNIEFAEQFPSLAMYGLLVQIALGICVVLLMLAGISYFFEEFNIVKEGTAYGIVARIIVLIPLYLVLPYLWDMVALLVESSALYLMDPFGGDPRGRTAELWCMMGTIACNIEGTTANIDPIRIFDGIQEYDKELALNQDSWNQALQTPFFGEDFVVNILLGLFKGFSVMFMTAMMFVLSAVRVLLTEVIVIALPLVTAIGLIPWIDTKKISDMFQQNLIGLTIAPIMSGIVLSVGMSTIDAQEMPPLRMWFQLLSVGFLAVFFPVMLSPMLGNISTKVGDMVSTSMKSATMAGSAGLQGMTRGMAQASNNMNRVMSTATNGFTKGTPRDMDTQTEGGRYLSSDIGTATSGANVSRTTMDKIKLYGKVGTIGMLGGIGSGMVQSTTQSMGVGGMDAVSKEMMSAGDERIDKMSKKGAAE